MTRFLSEFEDYLEDAAQSERLPRWLRRLLVAIDRTAGEAGALMDRHYAGL